jgi:hypothetical protein
VKPSYFENGVFNIAVHVRRNDMTIGDGNFYLRDSRVNGCVMRVIQRHAHKYPRHIHIFSWKVRPTLRLTSEENVTYHTDDFNATIETFNAFVHADALIVGMSTFSYAAGLFHEPRRSPVYVPKRKIRAHVTPAAWLDC